MFEVSTSQVDPKFCSLFHYSDTSALKIFFNNWGIFFLVWLTRKEIESLNVIKNHSIGSIIILSLNYTLGYTLYNENTGPLKLLKEEEHLKEEISKGYK